MNKTNQRIEELKKEIREFNLLEGTIAGLDFTEQLDLLELKAKLEATTQTLKEVEEVIKNIPCFLKDHYDEGKVVFIKKSELKKELGMEEK